MPRRTLVLTAAVAALALAGAQPPASAGDWPPEIQNLQVFREDIPLRELINEMRGFTSALGVRCQFCHVGEEGQQLSDFDFASDEKEHKKAARLMLRMVRAINEEHLSKLEGDEPPLRVECVTCHRGTAEPEQLPDLLVRLTAAEGADAAVARYRELRDSHYGGQSYDFGEQSLVRAAGRLAADGNLDAALSLVQLNLEYFPASAMTFGSLGQLRAQQGDREAAIAAFEKVLELEPENPRVKALLEEMRAAETAPQP